MRREFGWTSLRVGTRTHFMAATLAIFSVFLPVVSRGQTALPPLPRLISPVPFVDILNPTAVYPGHGDFNLVISGANFVPGITTVLFDGLTLVPLSATRNSITVSVPAAAVAKAHTASIRVKNFNFPLLDAITSNVVFFPITQETAGLKWAGPETQFLGPNQPEQVYDANAIAVADLNGDGHQDVVVAESGFLDVYLGNGALGFTLLGGSPQTTSLGTVQALEVGDFNNDGLPDVAASDGLVVTIFFNQGGGILKAGPTTKLPLPSSVVPRDGAAWCFFVGLTHFGVGDVNGDGILDLVFPDGGTDSFLVLLGDGTGNFSQAPSPITVGPPSGPQGSCSVALGDFNNDGWLDVAYGDATGHYAVLFNNAAGGWQDIEATMTNPQGFRFAAGDMNEDGFLDIVDTGFSGSADIFVNQQNETFAGTGPFAILPASHLYQDTELGDLGGRGVLDVVTVLNPDLSDGASVQPLMGSGDATLSGNPLLPGNYIYPLGARLGDFNEDGRLDIAYGGVPVSPTANPGASFEVYYQVPGAPVWSNPTQSFGTIIFHGGQMVGGQQQQSFTEMLSNSGLAPLDIASISSGQDFPMVPAATNCPLAGGAIQPTGNCNVALTFQPHTFGNFSELLTVVDDANSVPGSVQSVTLTGQALELDANIQGPISASGTSVFPAPHPILPVLFQLQENGVTVGPGLGCQLPPATIAVTQTAGANPGPVTPGSFAFPILDNGTNFGVNPLSCEYFYFLDTASLGPGSYLVQILTNPGPTQFGAISPGPINIGSATFALD
jgi:hypothetical protein